MKKSISSRAARWSIAIACVIAVPVGLVGALLAYIVLANWYAEYRARTFCEEVQIGSDIAVAVARFEKEVGKPGVLHYGDASGHAFLFIGAMLDKADCSIAIDEDGKVISRTHYMLYD